MTLGAWERAFIEGQRVARLATVDAQGRPHLVPIVYAFDGERLFTPLDAKPKRVKLHQLQRVRNIQVNPHVAVLLDIYRDDWSQLAWVQIRGQARLVEAGSELVPGVALLETKYAQYRTMSLVGRPVIVITVTHVTSWRARHAVSTES
jgi:PPOX class probable F420-dependent enzyme